MVTMRIKLIKVSLHRERLSTVFGADNAGGKQLSEALAAKRNEWRAG
jgi:hypothetical protein